MSGNSGRHFRLLEPLRERNPRRLLDFTISAAVHVINLCLAYSRSFGILETGWDEKKNNIAYLLVK